MPYSSSLLCWITSPYYIISRSVESLCLPQGLQYCILLLFRCDQCFVLKNWPRVCFAAEHQISQSLGSALLRMKLAFPHTKVVHHPLRHPKDTVLHPWLGRELEILFFSFATGRLCHANFFFYIFQPVIRRKAVILLGKWASWSSLWRKAGFISRSVAMPSCYTLRV